MSQSAVKTSSGSKFESDNPAYALLDEKQVGSIRHIGNLARQLRNDWSHMMGPADLKEDFGAYRFQLSYMGYALALAHHNRLPAAPGLFKPSFRRLTDKLMLPDVWFEWRDKSKGGGPLTLDIPMTEGWINPVIKDNIMYSAYLQSMALLYNVLFDDDHYAQPGALTLRYKPVFWNMQKGWEFVYDQNSLNELIYWNMVESGYLGIACEGACVFPICNQPAILGFRMHDHLTGGSIAKEVTDGFLRAWEEFGGLLDEHGHYKTLIVTHRKEVHPGYDPWSDAWMGALLAAWAPDYVKAHYPSQVQRWIKRNEDGLIEITPSTKTAQYAPGQTPASNSDMGWVAAWAAEVGDTDTVDHIFSYADHYLSPTYLNGGYHYPRNDEFYDDRGHVIASHPSQSNAIFPYARLNVKDGLHRLYSQPFDKEHFTEPALADVDFPVDLYRAVFDKENNELLFNAALSDAHKGKKAGVELGRVFSRGDWVMTRDGKKVAWGDSQKLIGTSELQSIRQNEAGIRLEIDHLKPAAYVVHWKK
jgi:hypothetical protein